MASAFELETHLLIIKEQKWFPEKTVNDLLEMIIEEQRMLNAFVNKL
jgi:four helix bundle protein